MLQYLILLVPVVSGQLPDYMLGEFKMESSEGFSDFMYELGVDWFTRSIACTIYPTQKITQAGDLITLDTSSTLKTTHTEFKLGEPWEEYTADKRTTSTVATLDGNRLIKVQTPDPSTGYHTTTEVREFVDNGNTMNMIMTIKDKPDIKSVRIYKRVIKQ